MPKLNRAAQFILGRCLLLSLGLPGIGMAQTEPVFKVLEGLGRGASINISASGSVAAYWYYPDAGPLWAIRYDVASMQSTLLATTDSLLGFPAVSGDGSVVRGLWSPTFTPFYYEHVGGVMDTQISPWIDLAAMSHDGNVTVGKVDLMGPARSTGGFNGTPVLLGMLPGGDPLHTSARDVSGDGSIVVGFADSPLGRQAFRWEAGGMAGLGDLPGGTFESRANAVSADGTTIVGNGNTAAGPEAFQWQSGTMTGLGDLPGGSFGSFANDTSGDGSLVVGTSFGATGPSSAFIWDATNGMRDLATVLESQGYDLQNVHLTSASGISSDGNTIVGKGTYLPDTLSYRLPWIAYLPESGFGASIAAGLFSLIWRERRRSPLNA